MGARVGFWKRVRALPKTNGFSNAVLLILPVGCVAAAVGRAPDIVWPDFAATLFVSFLASVYQLRHVALAVVVSLAPFIGVSLFVAADPSSSAASGLSYVVGAVAALLIGATAEAAVLADVAVVRAAAAALRTNLRLSLSVIVVPLLPALTVSRQSSAELRSVATACVFAVVAATILVPLGVSRLEFGEDFVARANRVREWRARFFGILAPVARRPYGISVCGIACVLSVILFFQTRPLHVETAFRPALLACSAVAVLSVYGTLLDLRRTIAVLAASAVAGVAGIWAFARAGTGLSAPSTAIFLAANMICLAVQLYVAISANDRLATEEDAIAGSVHAIESTAMPVGVSCFIAILTALPFLRESLEIWFCVAVIAGAGACSAIVFQPAFAIGIETLWPRRGKIEQRYRLQ